MRSSGYAPAQGDLVWLDFSPQVGHEQGGPRPGVVLSPVAYSRLIGLAAVCPVTGRAKGYPFEVKLPAGLPVSGVALADHVKSQDWHARNVAFLASLDEPTLLEVLKRTRLLLSREEA